MTRTGCFLLAGTVAVVGLFVSGSPTAGIVTLMAVLLIAAVLRSDPRDEGSQHLADHWVDTRRVGLGSVQTWRGEGDQANLGAVTADGDGDGGDCSPP